MFKRLRNLNLGTLLVAVLVVQQLFSTYHVFYAHSTDYSKGTTHEDGSLISDTDFPCYICANFNTTNAVFDFSQTSILSVSNFTSVILLGEEPFLSNRFETVFQRGPPTFYLL